MSSRLAPAWLLRPQIYFTVSDCNKNSFLPIGYGAKMNKRRLQMRNLILTATAIGAFATAAPAFANGHGHQAQNGYGGPQAYGNIDPRCQSERRTSRNVGGFLGALGGASAGRALAAAAVRPEGVILGTVVGAIVGSSLGNAAVDCSPRALYTQNNGRSYGASGYNYGNQPSYHQPAPVYYNQAPSYQQAPVYNQAPVYQPPVHQPPVVYHQQAPVYQAPVYQAPLYQAPVYQAPVHQAPVYNQQPMYQQPVYQPQQVVVGEDWYQPSQQSYYGQERRGPLVAAPSAYGRPDYVPQDSYVASQQAQTVVVTQTYQAGGPVYAPYQGGPVMVAPPGAPCGYQVCR
jgi:hypothetical protein